MYNLRSVSALYCIVLTAAFVSADIIDITLNSNPSYVSDELKVYLPMVSTSAEPPVGFNGANIGNGTGDGIDEAVGFSFVFQPLIAIENAYLTIDLTPRGTSTDELLFADNFSVRGYGYTGAKFYGNTRLKTLPSNVRTSLTFDLSQMDFSDNIGRYLGTEDLRVYLRDGDFSVVYADDAIIHSARLQIKTGSTELPPSISPTPPAPPTSVPEPPMSALLLIGLAVMGVKNRLDRDLRD